MSFEILRFTQSSQSTAKAAKKQRTQRSRERRGGNSGLAGAELDVVRDPAVHAKFAEYRKGRKEA
jgi:hypothetical protein